MSGPEEQHPDPSAPGSGSTEFIARPAPPTTIGQSGPAGAPGSHPYQPNPYQQNPYEPAAYQPTMARQLPPMGSSPFGPGTMGNQPPPQSPAPGFYGPGYPNVPGAYGAPPRRGRTLSWVLIAVSVVAVIALVAGGIVWWTQRDGDGDSQALLSGQLTGAYPSAPNAAWQLSASEAGGEQFVSPDPNRAQYAQVGAVHDAHSVVTLVGGSSPSAARRLTGVNTDTGNHWTSDLLVRGCSNTIVGSRIACYDESTISFVNTQTGTVEASEPSPAQSAYGIALNSSGAYQRWFADGQLSIAKFDASGKQVWTTSHTLVEGGPGGDASSFTATDSLVASAQSSVLVVSATDGRELLNRGGSATISPLSDGSIAVVTGTGTGPSFRQDTVVVVRPDGTLVEIPGRAVSAPVVTTPAQRDHLLVDGKWTSITEGQSTWAAALAGVDTGSSTTNVALADDREVITRVNDQLVAVDTTTGATRWARPTRTSYGANDFAVTDGERLIAANADGGIDAVQLSDGSQVWTLPASSLGGGGQQSRAPLVFATGGGLVTVTDSTITGFAPTGGAAVVPGAATTAPAQADEGTVTVCASAPRFLAEQFRTTAAGLVVTMKVVAGCADGDVLSGANTRISIADAGALVASGNFDFSRSPTAIPRSDVGEGITMELTYPPGSFYRTPDTLSGSSGSDSFSVDCDRGAQTTTSLPEPQAGSTASPQVATGPALPEGTDIGATTGNALRIQANSDRAFILANLNNRWVAQLSSKQPGLHADNRTWDNQAILDEFLALRLRFNDVRLLYSDEWSVFSRRGWWVTVAAVTFPGPDQANAWCAAQGFDGEHCFAKLVSTTASPSESTRYR